MRRKPTSRRLGALGAVMAFLSVLGLSAIPASAGLWEEGEFSLTPSSGPPGTEITIASETSCMEGENMFKISNLQYPDDSDPSQFVAVGDTNDGGSWSTPAPPQPLTIYSSPHPSTPPAPPPPPATLPPLWLELGSQVYTQGETMNMATGGWMPESEVNITIFSDPIDVGSFLADSLGNISLDWTIPQTLAAGTHTVVMTGFDLAGTLTSISTTFDVLPLASAIDSLSPTTVAAGTPAATTTSGTLPRTGPPLALPLAIAGLMLTLGGAGLMAATPQRRGAELAEPSEQDRPGPSGRRSG